MFRDLGLFGQLVCIVLACWLLCGASWAQVSPPDLGAAFDQASGWAWGSISGIMSSFLPWLGILCIVGFIVFLFKKL